ncbi:MAG: efflux RND transporter periplasmic adaptor subunit [Bacteroidota bacterium]
MQKLLLLSLSLLLLLGCREEYAGQFDDPGGNADAPIPVKVVALTTSTEPIPIEAGGVIGAKEETNLSFKIGGLIDRVYVEEGQQVRSGQLLATLKTTEIDAQVAQAQQAVDKSRRDLERIERLYADSAATLEMVQNLRTALEVAESDLEIAGFNQQFAKIYAPASGRVLKQFAEAGELAGPGSPIYRLISEGRNAYVLRVGVTDRDFVKIALGDAAEIRLDAYPSTVFSARVTELAAAADPYTGTFQLEITLEPEDYVIRNGFVGRVRIFPSREPAYVKLPMSALVEGNGQSVSVYYPDEDGLARAQKVRFRSLSDEAFIVPVEDLAGIERVITAGAAYLSEGDSLNIQP